MAQVVFVRELKKKDARSVKHLVRLLRTAAFREIHSSVKTSVERTLDDGCRISMGLFDGGRMVGYILAFVPEIPGIRGRLGEKKVCVFDLAVLPAYRHYFYLLMRKFLSRVTAFFPDHFVEAVIDGPSIERWLKHTRLYEKLGYRLKYVRREHLPSVHGGICRLTWEPMLDSSKSTREPPLRTNTAIFSRTTGGRSFTVELVRSEAGWTRLEPFWNDLLRRTPDYTVFQSYEYLRIWWHHFGLPQRLFILVIRVEGKPVGIAPLQISPVTVWGRYFRLLTFIGSRWEMDRPILIFPFHTRECIELTLEALRKHANRWDICQLYEQAPESPAVEIFQRTFGGDGYNTAVTEDSPHPYLVLNCNWEAFWRSRSQRFRKNLRSSKRKLESVGQVELKRCSEWPEVEEKLELYMQVEAGSWKAGMNVGVCKSAEYIQFYRNLARLLGRQEQFHILFLTLSSTPVAATIALLFEGKYHSIQIAHNAQLNKYSPGTLLEALEIEDCFKRGYKEYDFMGGFLNNKLRWTSTVRRTVQIHLFRNTSQLNLPFIATFKVKPKVKGLLRRLRLLEPLLKIHARMNKYRYHPDTQRRLA